MPAFRIVLILLHIVVSASACGQRTFSGRIVGGTVADAKRYPWYVALVQRSKGIQGTLDVLCGANLVSSRHLLTAAHCFNGIPIGTHKDFFRAMFILENRCTPKFATSSTVDRVVIHPQYNAQTLKNDIAVMTLTTEVTYTPVCLPPARPNMRGEATVVGYGNTKMVGQSYPCQLQDATVRMFTRTECLRTGNFIDVVSLPNVVCAGRRGGGVDTCDGDSGGPLLRLTSAGQFYLQGITSFGHGCARRNNPGVYTDVSKYLNWIRRTTGLNRSAGIQGTKPQKGIVDMFQNYIDSFWWK